MLVIREATEEDLVEVTARHQQQQEHATKCKACYAQFLALTSATPLTASAEQQLAELRIQMECLLSGYSISYSDRRQPTAVGLSTVKLLYWSLDMHKKYSKQATPNFFWRDLMGWAGYCFYPTT